MSGPKAVQFISLEERLETCRSALAEHRVLVEAWLERLRRAGLDEPGDRDLADRMLEDLSRFIDGSDPDGFHRRLRAAQHRLDGEFDLRAEAAVERRRREITAERHRIAAAATVLAEVDRTGIALPGPVTDLLKQARAGNPVDGTALNQAITQASTALAPTPAAPELSDAARALAERLRDGLTQQSLSDWLDQLDKPHEQTVPALDTAIADLGVRHGPETAEAFQQRLRHAAAEPDADRRRLLMDSLTIEIAQAARQAIARQRLDVEARAVLARLARHGDALAPEMGALAVAGDARDTGELRVAIDAAKDAEAAHIARQGLAARRRALLRALDDLGYAVEDGMEAEFARSGRVVVASRDHADYGIELAGLLANDRLQVRATKAEDSGQDDAADTAFETVWCGDFTKLRESLAGRGETLRIERAHAVGTVPVKRTVLRAAGAHREGARQQNRTRRQTQ